MIVEGLSIVVAVSTEYWGRFGDGWTQSVLALEPKPEHVFIASEEPLVLPEGWLQVQAVKPLIWDAFTQVISQSPTTYAMLVNIDDRLPTDALDDLVLEGDIICSAMIDTEGVVSVPCQKRYENIVNAYWYPLMGSIIFHREVLNKIPFRPTVWMDWIAAFEYKAHKLDIRFNKKIRYIYNIEGQRLSNPADPSAALSQVAIMRNMVRHGMPQPGNVWPPVLMEGSYADEHI